MKEKIKIVLADDNKDFCQVLKEYLSNEDDQAARHLRSAGQPDCGWHD